MHCAPSRSHTARETSAATWRVRLARPVPWAFTRTRRGFRPIPKRFFKNSVLSACKPRFITFIKSPFWHRVTDESAHLFEQLTSRFGTPGGVKLSICREVDAEALSGQRFHHPWTMGLIRRSRDRWRRGKVNGNGGSRAPCGARWNTPDIGCGFGPRRQAPHQITHIRFRKARREQQLDLLVTLAATSREQLRRVLRAQVLVQLDQHRKLQLASRDASERLRIFPTNPRRRNAPTRR